MDIYLLLRCAAHEGVSIYGAFDTEEKAMVAFNELARDEMGMLHDASEHLPGFHVVDGKPYDDLGPLPVMEMNWDSEKEAQSGWAIRCVEVNQTCPRDIGLKAREG